MSKHKKTLKANIHWCDRGDTEPAERVSNGWSSKYLEMKFNKK